MTPEPITRNVDGVVHGHLLGADGRLAFGEAMRALGDRAVRARLTAALAEAPFDAFFWECAPCGRDATAPFEFVLVDSPGLARVTADPRPFAAHIGAAGGARTFPNLGRRSLLIAPDDVGPAGAHLARFVREAPAETVDALWAAVPPAVERWFAGGARTLWLSTSGLGVHWLHLRLDPTPKYYTWRPFRAPPAGGAVDP